MKPITPDMTVRLIAADYPGAREVFLRYGEQDRPEARFGHFEPLRGFAHRKDIPLDQLLRELAAATGAPIGNGEQFVERVHQGFIVTALFIALSAGAGWGAWLLWVIGFEGNFDAVRGAYVVAHGDAQLWGFVAFFIFGISLRTVLQPALRRRWGTALWRSILSLGLVGVAGGFIWSLFPISFAPMGWLSGLALVLMSLLWLATIVTVLQRQWKTTWVRALLAAALWLLAWGISTAWFRAQAGASGPEAYTMVQRLLAIELAVFGFTMNTIYAFGQRLLPGLLRLGSPRRKPIEIAHWLHNAGALAVCAATGLAHPGPMAATGSVLMLCAACLFVFGHRGLIGRRRGAVRPEHGHPALDFYPPLAFFWLVVSLVLLSAGYFYESAAGDAPPRAYSGAVRHALTVGFVTTLIVGVGQRLLPVLERTTAKLPRLTIPILVLIGLGNFLRVASELAAVQLPSAFLVMPFSAFLEWSALLLFACTTLSTMFWRESPLRSRCVSENSSLAILLAECPWIEDRLIARGNRYLADVRNVPPELTIATFARQHAGDSDALVHELNMWLRSDPDAETSVQSQ